MSGQIEERMAPQPPVTVALLQRYLPHYRLSLFQKLHRQSRFRWELFFDQHGGLDWSGLAPDSYGELRIHPAQNRNLFAGLSYQSGLRITRDECAAIMLDLGWTLLSNPKYLLEAKLKGVGRVGWSKGIPQISRQKSKLRLAYERFIIGHCDALVVYGQMSREYFRGLGYPDERIFVAQNCVDTTAIIADRTRAIAEGQQLRTQLGLDSRPVVGYLGKMAPFKQVDRIVAAFDRARHDGMEAVLVLAGNGSARSAIEQQIAGSPFNKDIHLIVDVPIGAEAGYFQLFDLYASFAQGGLGILEAMAHGRPVLSTPERYPETELLEENETAFLSEDFSVDGFGHRMAEAIANGTLRSDVGRRAEKRVAAEATQELMVEAIDQAVERALVRW